MWSKAPTSDHGPLRSPASETGVRDLLPRVRARALVLHRAEELIPVERGRYLPEHIPDARLVVLPGIDHSPF